MSRKKQGNPNFKKGVQPAHLQGKDLSANPQNINKNGRPKRITNVLLSEGFSKADIVAIVGALLNYTEEELKEVEENTGSTIIEKIICAAMLKALNTGEYAKIRDLVELKTGKPSQQVDQTVDQRQIIKILNLGE